MKGKNQFNKEEEKQIRALLSEKVSPPSGKQKRIRDILRKKIGFYISDFTNSNKGFTIEDFDMIKKDKRILII